MERKDFVNILSLAVTSAFPEVDEVVLYRMIALWKSM